MIAKELLKYYYVCLKQLRDLAESLRSSGVDSNVAMKRLEEADAMYPPVRKLSQRIEYPRTAEKVKQTVEAQYQRAAAPHLQRIAHAAIQYLGSSQSAVPPELEQHRTLFEFLDKGDAQLRSIGHRLDARFDESRKDEGTDRRQSLIPKGWGKDRYDEQLHKALLTSTEFSGPQPGTVNWDKINESVLKTLRTDFAKDYADVRTLPELLDKWFHKHQVSETDIKRIADTLASACRKLIEGKLNLKDYYDGSVIDLLMIKHEPDRKEKLGKLVKLSAPYLPLDSQSQATVNNNYRPTFQNLLGKKVGNSEEVSAGNERRLLEELDGEAHALDGDEGRIQSKLDDTSSALVLCREVWGVPLRYYAFLDTLQDEYKKAGKDAAELHINHHMGADELPDIRMISSVVYESIRDNIDTVLWALIRGAVTCDPNGSYVVQVPQKTGHMLPYRLGSRISRIIKTCCERSAVLEHLQATRAEWERNASSKDLALVYASAVKTCDDCFIEVKPQFDEESTPLSNCVTSLSEHFKGQLLSKPDGAKWYEHFRVRNASHDSAAAVANYLARYKQLIDNRILNRKSPHVPIYEVDFRSSGYNDLQC